LLSPGNIFPGPGTSAIKEKNLAYVAILYFINNTGSDEFNWLQNSLGAAVYESMKETFEFNRTDSLLVEKTVKKKFKPGKEPSSSDIAYLAEQTKSDIVIFGEYDFDKIKNKIVIKTKIYHTSRKEITSVISIESSADSTLFKVVDRVSGKIVTHIAVIAKEDIKKSEKSSKKKDEIKTVKIESPEKDTTPDKIDISSKDDVKVEKKEKIILQKSENTQIFSKYFYVDIAAAYYSPTLVYSTADPYGISAQNIFSGIGFRLNISNSYSSFILVGSSLNISFLYVSFPDTSIFNNTSSDNKFSLSGNIQLLFGLNWNINNKVFIQPYIQFGVALEDFSALNMVNFTGVFSFGIKVPVRIGKDIFVTPFIELSGYALSLANKDTPFLATSLTRMILIAGVGFSF
jgi:hypothetical protein